MNLPIAIVLTIAASCLTWIDAGATTARVKSETVEYADLDLSDTQGAATLYQRLRSAARKVCRDTDASPTGQYQRFHRCVSQATATAIAQVDSDVLSTYVANRPGRRLRSI